MTQLDPRDIKDLTGEPEARCAPMENVVDDKGGEAQKEAGGDTAPLVGAKAPTMASEGPEGPDKDGEDQGEAVGPEPTRRAKDGPLP